MYLKVIIIVKIFYNRFEDVQQISLSVPMVIAYQKMLFVMED